MIDDVQVNEPKEDQDRDEEEEIMKNQPKRRKRKSRLGIDAYIDDAAEESGEENYNRKEHKDDKKLQEYYKSHKRTSYLQKFRDKDEDEIIAHYNERAKQYEREEQEEAYRDDTTQPKELIRPTIQDPRLYSIKCKIGEERATAIGIMKKFHDLKNTSKSFNIMSVLAINKMNGHILIEAKRTEEVRKAIQGFLSIKNDYIKLIPLNQVGNILTSDPKKKIEVQIGQFVRIKKGLYEKDLALVDQIDIDQNAVYVRIVPRIEVMKKKEIGKKKIRPVAKLFTVDENIKDQVSNLVYNKEIFSYRNNRFENGFLKKKFRMNNIIISNIFPTYEEVQLFKNGETNEHKKQILIRKLAKISKQASRSFKFLFKGDQVKIKDGEYQDKKAIVIDKDHHKRLIKVLIIGSNSTGPIQYQPQRLEKIFKIGDQVEILMGHNKGVSGTIINLMGKEAQILSNNNKKEITLFKCDLKKKTKGFVSSLSVKKSKYELQRFDLVKMNDDKTVGVILQIQRDSIQLFDTEGMVKNFQKIHIKQRISNKLNVINSYKQDIQTKSIVKILTGIEKDTIAPVIHVYQEKVFIRSKEKSHNFGVMVVDASSCYVLQSNTFNNLNRRARFNNRNIKKSEDPEFAKKIQNPDQRKIALIGQKKKIIQGKWKGYEGMIRSINDRSARFELSAKNKVITIPLDHLNIPYEDKKSLRISNKPDYPEKTSVYNKNSSPFAKQFATPVYNPDKK